MTFIDADDADDLTGLIKAAEAKNPEDLTEEDKMALLGRPRCGEVVKAQLRIKESKEFKVSLVKFDSIMFHFYSFYYFNLYFWLIFKTKNTINILVKKRLFYKSFVSKCNIP